MTTKWSDPRLDYRPPRRAPLAWGKVAWLVLFPLVTWMLVLTAAWMHWA